MPSGYTHAKQKHPRIESLTNRDGRMDLAGDIDMGCVVEVREGEVERKLCFLPSPV